MESLDILAHWLGWADMAAALLLVFGAGLPTKLGRAPRGMVRFLFYGVGFVCCRYDLQPRLCDRLREMGYTFVGTGPWRLALALPGKVRRIQRGHKAERRAGTSGTAHKSSNTGTNTQPPRKSIYERG